MKRKIINVTHKDLDGIVCAILLNNFCYAKDIDFEYVPSTYRNVDKMFSESIKENCQIFITDISLVNESNFPELSEMSNIHFIDHHPRDAKSAIKKQYHGIDKGAGCKMVFDYIEKTYNYKFDKHLRRLMLIANDYDLWIHDYKISKLMNRLFYYHGVDKFFLRFASGFNGKWTEEEKTFFVAKAAEIQEIKDNLMIKKISDSVRLTVVSKEVDEMAEYVQQKENAKYVFIYNDFLKSVSVRATADAEVHLGNFVKEFGGGGHEKAAAVSIEDETKLFTLLEAFVEKIGE